MILPKVNAPRDRNAECCVPGGMESSDFRLTVCAVIFLPPAPVHPHIYSNGHICLSILYQGGWSPALKVESVCMSILSMLSSAEKKAKPEDNDRYVRTAKKSPKDTSWVFHDSKA